MPGTRVSSGADSASAMRIIRTTLLVRSNRNAQSPLLIVNARRRLSSSMPPRMKPSSSGAIGKFRILRPTAAMATITSNCRSKLLKETRYTPIIEKNMITGIRMGRGIASSLAMYGISGRLRTSRNRFQPEITHVIEPDDIVVLSGRPRRIERAERKLLYGN